MRSAALGFLFAFLTLHVALSAKAKVLILGGGIAGLQAAYHLKTLGINDILLVEADDHVGGRLVAGHVAGIPSDSAFWEVDERIEERDVLGIMLDECKVSISDFGLPTRVFIDEKGNVITTEAEARRKDLEAALRGLKTDWQGQKLTARDDLTMHAALRLYGWHPRNSIDVAVEGWIFDSLLQPGEQSASNYLYTNGGLNSYSEHAEMYAAGQDENFSTMKLVDCMKNFVFAPNDERLLLNKRVTKIRYSTTGVTAIDENGTTYEGDYGVVTFSLGILQEDFVEFQPRLPYRKRLAINEFVMLPLTLVWVRFDRRIQIEGERYRFYLFANAHRWNWHWCRDVLSSNQNASFDVLRFWLTGENALRIERQSLNETLDEVNEVMMSAFGVAPVSVVLNHLNYDRRYYGGYRAWPTGVTLNDFDELRRPVWNRLFFAGDAYQIPLFARAAAISGNETAQVIADCMAGKSCGYEMYGESLCSGAALEEMSLVALSAWAFVFATLH